MNRRDFIKMNAALAASTCLPVPGLLGAVNKYATTKPNIVFILADDLGWMDLGCYGNGYHETPNIDQLSREGIRFTNAYVPAPICSPTRAAALTGKHPMEFGMWEATHYLPKEVPILPMFLRQASYQTGHVGKWHIGCKEQQSLPIDRGFDFAIGGSKAWGSGSYFWPYDRALRGLKPHPRDAAAADLKPGGKEGEYLTDRLASEAVKFIDSNDGTKPLFLNLWFYSAHKTHQAKPDKIEKYKNKLNHMNRQQVLRQSNGLKTKLRTVPDNPVYAAMVESIDEAVGTVINKLKQKGIYDNTLIIFYSDNGPTTDVVACPPLNGGKNTTYEGGIREPAIMRFPSMIPSGMVSATPIIIMDVFETIMELAKAPKPKGYQTDGVSLLPLFAGDRIDPRKMFFYFPRTQPPYGGRSSAAVIDEQGYKYIHFYTGDSPELYDLNNDLGEFNNLFDIKPEIAAKLKLSLAQWIIEHNGKALD